MKIKILTLFVGMIFLSSFAFAQTNKTIAEYTHGFSINPKAEIGKIYQNNISPIDALTMITHSSSQTIVGGNSVACGAGGLHADNSYYRVFDLQNDFGITTDWRIATVDVGIETATGATGTQPVEIKLYTATSTDLSTAVLTEFYSETFNVDDANGIVQQFVLSGAADIAAGSILVVEFFTPDGQTDGNSFYIGSNNLGETDDSYLAAADCGFPAPTTLANIGFPNMQIVMNVWGDVPPTTLIIGDVTGDIGQMVSVPVDAVDVTDMVAFQWTIDYDNTVLAYDSCSNWDAAVDVGPLIVTDYPADGKITFVYENYPNGIDIADGKLFDLHFDIDPAATPGPTTLSWSDDPTPRELSNSIPSVIYGGWNDGSVTVDAFDVTFVVDDGINPIAGADVTFAGYGTLTTDASGQAIFTQVVPGTGLGYLVEATGFDLANGSIDVVDADITENVTLNASPYCHALANVNNTREYINTFEFGTMNNASTGRGFGGYQDFTSISADIMHGSIYNFTITLGSGFTQDKGRIWIDWNQDGDFEDGGEMIFESGVGTGPFAGTVEVPITAKTGQTRMRARIWDSSDEAIGVNGGSCGNENWGEVEDYTINILPEGQWTGATSTAWSEAGNWTYTTMPTPGTDVTIPAAPSNQPVISGTGDSVNTLAIESGASLTIEPGAELTVVSDFTNNGAFTINSDATGTGSVITNGTVTGIGSYDVNLYLTAQRWLYVSSPIAGNTSDVFGLDADNTLYWWNETNTGTHGWNEITSTTTLNDLQGYAYKKGTAGATTKQFTGDINTGPYGAVDNLTSEGSTFQGFNLIGNPYPSPIHLDTLPNPTGITLTNVYPTVWFRNDDNLATYNWTSGTGQNNGEAVVPNMQGFWVKVADGFATGGIQFTNEARTHMKPHGIYKDKEENIFRLTLNSNGNKDETVIGFYDAAQDIEDSYDSEKMFAQFGATPEVYSIIDGKEFAINGYSIFTKDHLAIPLGVKSQVNANALLLAENIDDFDIYPVVYLEDKHTNEMIDLNKQNGYEFALNNGVVNNRFVLHMGQDATSIEESERQIVDIYAFADVIYLRNNGIKGRVMVYDMLGKTVFAQEIHGKEDINKINMHGYTGNFVVRFVTSEGVYMQKVFVH